jgi:hypothetical protein
MGSKMEIPKKENSLNEEFSLYDLLQNDILFT